MVAPVRCADCFFDGCPPDCACRCHRGHGGVGVSPCLYCRAGHHELHEQSLRLGQSQPDVVACPCTFLHQKKEGAK